jgi:hypothetical protein
MSGRPLPAGISLLAANLPQHGFREYSRILIIPDRFYRIERARNGIHSRHASALR